MEDVKINVKIKLSGAWAAVMFLYVYGDFLGLYNPGFIEKLIAGEMLGIQITQILLLGIAIFMAIPSVMVFLSLTLKPKWNRWTNIIVGILFIVAQLSSNFVGEPWAYYMFASIVEVVLLSLIIGYAWKWPKQEGQS